MVFKTSKTHANVFRIHKVVPSLTLKIRAAYLHLSAASATHRQRSFSGLPLKHQPSKAPPESPLPDPLPRPTTAGTSPAVYAQTGTCAGFTYARLHPSRPSVPTAFPAVQNPQNLDSTTIFTDDQPGETCLPFSSSIARFFFSRSIAPAR